MNDIELPNGGHLENIILELPESPCVLEEADKQQLVRDIATLICKAQVTAMHMHVAGRNILNLGSDTPRPSLEHFDQTTAEIVQLAGEIILLTDLRDGSWLDGEEVQTGKLQGLSYESSGQGGPEIRYIFANFVQEKIQEVTPHQLVSLGDVAVGDMKAQVPFIKGFPPQSDSAIQ